MNAEARALKALCKENKNTHANLYVGEVRGEVWYTESHFASKTSVALRSLFIEYNLNPDEPGAYMVNGSVIPAMESRVPDIANIVPTEVGELAEWATVRGAPILARGPDGHLVRAMAFGDHFVAVRDDYMTHLEQAGVRTWFGTNEDKPLVGKDAKEIVAVVMGVKRVFS
jgi:hypothetical protein